MDYESLYLWKYKNLPNLIFWFAFITSLVSLISGTSLIFSFLSNNSYARHDYSSTIVTIVMIEIISSLIWSLILRYITAVFISQKIVATDKVSSIEKNLKNSSNSSDNIDNLPEI